MITQQQLNKNPSSNLVLAPHLMEKLAFPLPTLPRPFYPHGSNITWEDAKERTFLNHFNLIQMKKF